MFRKFAPEDISTQNQVKSSVQRAIRSGCHMRCVALQASCLRSVFTLLHTNAFPAVAGKVCASYPLLEETGAIEQIFPKKESAVVAKLCAARVVRPVQTVGSSVCDLKALSTLSKHCWLAGRTICRLL